MLVLLSIWTYHSPRHVLSITRPQPQQDPCPARSCIPRKIWQILLPRQANDTDTIVSPELLQDTASWVIMNPGYE